MPREAKEFLTAPSDQPIQIVGSIANAADGRITVIYKNWTNPAEDGTLVKKEPQLDHTMALDELGFHDLVIAGVRASGEDNAAMKVTVTVAGTGEVILAETSVPFTGPVAAIRLNILTY